jgi:polyisoprenoid-binding protein YceI
VKRILVVGLIVVVGAVGGLLWWTGRSEAPPPLSVDEVGADAAGAGAATDALDGRWEVVAGDDTLAGLRIDEERAGGLSTHTAVGRTGEVTGSLEVEGDEVRSGSFAVDLASLEFTDDPGLPVAERSTYLRSRALETDRFPEAVFTIDAPVPLPDLASGTAREVPVEGTLELHGVEQPMTLLVDVRRTGDDVVLGTTEPVVVRLSDHDIEAPSIPGVATVTDEGSFEFVVVLRRA